MRTGQERREEKMQSKFYLIMVFGTQPSENYK